MKAEKFPTEKANPDFKSIFDEPIRFGFYVDEAGYYYLSGYIGLIKLLPNGTQSFKVPEFSSLPKLRFLKPGEQILITQ